MKNGKIRGPRRASGREARAPVAAGTQYGAKGTGAHHRSRLSAADAQVVGEAHEEARKKYGEGFTIGTFAEFCRTSEGRIHDLWRMRVDRGVEKAEHEAARWLLQQVILVRIESQPAALAPRAIIVLTRGAPESEEDDDEDSGGEVYGCKAVQQSVDLLQRAEDDFRRNARGCIEGFAAIAGVARARRVVEEILSALGGLEGGPPKKSGGMLQRSAMG